jgi:DNA-binding MarR family transcriptional regulator
MQPSAKSSGAGEALLRASRVLVSVAARSLADVEEVTLPQFRALVVISSHDTTTVSNLAHALDVHSTTATRLCDRLVDKELVRRAPKVGDRRVIELHLTPAGRGLVNRVTNRRRRDITAIASRMSARSAAAAVDALEAFADAAGEPAGTVDLFGWDDPERS